MGLMLEAKTIRNTQGPSSSFLQAEVSPRASQDAGHDDDSERSPACGGSPDILSGSMWLPADDESLWKTVHSHPPLAVCSLIRVLLWLQTFDNRWTCVRFGAERVSRPPNRPHQLVGGLKMQEEV